MGPVRRRPVILAVLDGWGAGPDGEFNALARAGLSRFPVWRAKSPYRTLEASGAAVGLPDGQMGNSEVGHLTLGAGRVLYQELPRISRAVHDGSFFENTVLREACRLSRGGTLHLAGLVSDGGVHSHQEHLYALLELARREGIGKVAVHAILDGRDTPPTAGAGYLEALQRAIASAGVGRIATVVGRYYAMDRDQRWERTRAAFRLYTAGEGILRDDAAAAVRESYAEGVTDEFVKPVVLPCPYGRMADGDGVIFFNFRADRARQIASALTQEPFDLFPRGPIPRLATYTTFSRYHRDFSFPVAFEKEDVAATLGEVLSGHGLRQLRIAETEKYAHVTFFFNGGRETVFPGEDRVLVPSPKVATYDLQPEMSAPRVTEEILQRLEPGRYDFVLLNFANPDMVGHTGNFAAACAAARVVDACMGRVVDKALGMGGAVVVTADHGNLEQMREADGASPHTAHTTNPVPLLWLCADSVVLSAEPGLGLSSIAPAILAYMGLLLPDPMRATPPLLWK